MRFSAAYRTAADSYQCDYARWLTFTLAKRASDFTRIYSDLLGFGQMLGFPGRHFQRRENIGLLRWVEITQDRSSQLKLRGKASRPISTKVSS